MKQTSGTRQEIHIINSRFSFFTLLEPASHLGRGCLYRPWHGVRAGGNSILSAWPPPTLLVPTGLQPSGHMGHCWILLVSATNDSMFLSFSEPLANSCEQQAMHSALWGPSPYDWTCHRRVFCSHTRQRTPELWKLLHSPHWEETQGL